MSNIRQPLIGAAADAVRDQLAATVPPAGPAPLSPLHDLLSAIVDSLDVPYAAGFDDRAYYQLLETRALQLRGYLRGMVDNDRVIEDWHADGIREMTAATPITYPAYSRPDKGAGHE